MSTIIGYFGDNASQVNAQEYEAKLRKELPQLLQPDDQEQVGMAFVGRAGKGRDSMHFTNKRVVMVDKMGMTGTKTDYFSIPNTSIQAWAVQTGGTLDSDCELKLYVKGMAKTTNIDFCKGADILALQHHLNQVVLAGEGSLTSEQDGGSTSESTTAGKGSTSGGGFLGWIGNNATQIDEKVVQEELSEKRVILPDETVELAFKCGRDSFLITSKRLLKINVQGMTGKKTEYFSITWPAIRAFSVETAGTWDNDSELLLYTCLGQGMTRIPMEFRKRKADIYAVQRCIADKLLGMDTVDPSHHADAHNEGGLLASVSSMFGWMADDSRMMDATKMDKQYHSNPPILQTCETVEMAFKGRRDLVLFTGKRLLLVDLKGFSAKKVEYVTIPWSTVQAFGVRSAGAMMDKDGEMLIWTDFDDTLANPDVPPIPRKSFLEMDFNKNSVDWMTLHRYLSDRCLHVDDGGLRPNDVPVPIGQPSSSNAVSSFLSWMASDAHAVDAPKLDGKLHNTDNAMLREDEHVAMAFKSGRDMTILTTRRILIMDTRGMSGKKLEWISIPYTSLRAFSCENAHGFGDRDSEVKLYCKIYWYASNPCNIIEQDFRKGKADIVAIQSFLSRQVMGSQDGSSGLVSGSAATPSTFSGKLNPFTDDGVEVDAGKVQVQLASILLDDETVDVAFRIGSRDMCVFTSLRILMVDRKGLSGKKVEYKTLPLRYCTAFKLYSGGSLFGDAEATVYMDVPGAKEVRQDLRKSKSDIWAIQTMLANKMMK